MNFKTLKTSSLICLLVLLPHALQAQVVDRSTMTNKVMAGYQGWFAAPGDGNDPAMGWGHWGSGGNMGPGFYHCDVWPDVTEYDSSDLFFVPNTVLTQGGTPYLFSPYRQGAVDVHFRWMQEYGIDGAFLQRFIIETRDPNSATQKHRDRVLQNVMNASTTYGRTFAVEYDTSGGNTNTLYSELVNDWTYLKNTYDLKNHSRYLYHDGKPVVVIWGIGVGDRPGTPPIMQQIIDWFKADGCFVIGGVPRAWRSDSTWINVFRSLNGITPWTVGSYRTATDIRNYRINTVAGDIAECNSRGILYMPTAWPRFQWDNMNAQPCGTSYFSPRDGQHLWDQVYQFKYAGAQVQFIAMFDEYDEGTAIMKCTDNVPTSGCWMTTDGKGNDWFLRLANQAGRMYRGEIPTSQTLPISSATIPDNAQIISATIPATMTAGQQYSVSVTVRNTGETYWNSQTFKLGAVGDYDPFYPGDRVEMDTGEMLAPNQQKTFTFTLTAPPSPGTYLTEWRMVHEKIRWFGGTLSKQVQIGADTNPPAPVTGFTSIIADRQVTLNWNNPADADFTGTMIRFKTMGYPTGPADGTLVCNRSTPPGQADSFVHTGLTNGVTYYYAAYAYDGATNYAIAATAVAVPQDITAPGPAQNFRATGGDGRNTLAWTNPTDIDFAGMRIVVKTNGSPTGPTDGSVVYSGIGTNYNHTGLTEGVVYYYAAYAFDGVPHYSTASFAGASPSQGACLFEVFPYPDGYLSGNNGWVGAATNQIEMIDQTVKINGAEPTWDVYQSVSCTPVGGVVWLRANVRSGIGAATLWGLWLDDASGVNLARWYGTGTTARGRIGATSSVTSAENLTGGWDSIAARVDVNANTTEFFFNGQSIGVLSHLPAGDSVGRLKIERIGYMYSTGDYMYLDNVFVGQMDMNPPSPVTSFSAAPGDGRIDLSWVNPSDSNFAGTMVRCETNGYPTSHVDGTLVYQGSGTSFAHTSLTNGTTYYYSAFAYDGFPNYSEKVDASATPVDATPPSNVSGFSVIRGNTRNTLIWNNPSTSDFTGTMIRFKTTGYPTGPTDGILVVDKAGSPGASDSFVHEGLNNGPIHYYRAYSHDALPNHASGMSSAVNPAYFDPFNAKLLSNYTTATITESIVSAAFTDMFYIQSPDKLVGIRVDQSGHSVQAGQSVGVRGTVLTDVVNDEKYILANWSAAHASDSVSPVAMGNMSVGGTNWNYNSGNGAGQNGVAFASGPNNIGLLVLVWGRVTQRDKNLGFFYIDDGSGLRDGTITEVSNGVFEESVGVRILANPTAYPQGSYVTVKGAVSTFNSNGLRPRILPVVGGVTLKQP